MVKDIKAKEKSFYLAGMVLQNVPSSRLVILTNQVYRELLTAQIAYTLHAVNE